MEPDQKDLSEALRHLARDEATQSTPPGVEDAVMRRWSSFRGRKTGWGRIALVRRPVFAMAASVTLGLVVSGWWLRGGVAPPGGELEPAASSEASAWHSYDRLAWLDPNPASLQIVRLRVASETLRTQGYAVSDPDGDGTVEIEMVLGSDGMARSVLVTAETPMN